MKLSSLKKLLRDVFATNKGTLLGKQRYYFRIEDLALNFKEHKAVELYLSPQITYIANRSSIQTAKLPAERDCPNFPVGNWPS